MLGIELIDTSPGVTSESERQRIGKMVAVIRDALDAQGTYAVVDAKDSEAAVEPVRQSEYLHDCNGCELDLGKQLGADWVLVGWIQKVSNLILNLNVIVRDVTSGSDVAVAFVDLRGNTDESWIRASQYLMDRILLKRLSAKL